MAEGKIIKWCAECGYFNKQRHQCRLGHNKEDNPRDHFYDDCTSLEDLAEHDKRVKADAIDEIKELIKTRITDNLSLDNATKYGNKNSKQQANSYSTVMKYEIADCVEDLLEDMERLKERNNG